MEWKKQILLYKKSYSFNQQLSPNLGVVGVSEIEKSSVWIWVYVSVLRINLLLLIWWLGFDFWIFKLNAWFACEFRTAVWEWSRFVCLIWVQFAAIILKWQWAAIFNQFLKSSKKIIKRKKIVKLEIKKNEIWWC